MLRLLALALLSGGCFTEAAIIDTCRDGEPGCDCDDGTCVEGSECVVSIDKCVPEDCTPGTRTCTCAAGDVCDGDLVCREGVCAAEGTGSGTADSQASNASASASEGTVTSASMTSTTSDVDSMTTTEPVTSATGIEPTSAETGSPGTTTGIISTECAECLEQGWSSGDCLGEVADCMDLMGCTRIYMCHTTGMGDCCDAADEDAVGAWGTFLDCAAMACDAGVCDFAAIDCD